MARENWDYAIDMFSKSVSLVPDNLMYRQTLRGCERKKYGDNGSGARMASMKLMKVKGRIKKSRMQKDWAAVDRAAEEGLIVNPWDAQLNHDQGQACVELGFSDCALFGLQNAVACDPKSKDHNRALATLLEERGAYNDAIKCWQRIHNLDNDDDLANQKISELSTKSVIEGGGYEKAEGSRDVKAGGSAYDDYRPSGGRSKQPTADGPGMDPIKDLERQIRKEPENYNHYVKLGELHRNNRNFAEAREALQKALEITGGDHNIRQEMEDTEIEELRSNLDVAKDAVRNNPDDETARQNAGALAVELVDREIEVLASRVDRYPKDSKMKFELAQRLIRRGKTPAAIPLLQQASTDQRIEVEVLVALGECFVKEKKDDLALRQFRKAIPKIDPMDRTDLFKKCRYMMGRLCESLEQKEEAEEHYNEILAIDYEYKDVLKRLDEL